MKILMSNYEFPPIGGGAGRANLNLLEQFAANDRISIDLLTSHAGRGNLCEQFADNITIHKIGVHKKNLHYWRRTEVLEWLFKAEGFYRRLMRQNEYDLAHAFFAFPTGWLCYRHAARIPYVISLRGSDVPGYNVRLGTDYKLLSGLFGRIWKSASAVVANSTGLAELAKKFVDLDIGVICNGVDTKRYYPGDFAEIATPIRLLTVSRLIGRKRIDLLMRAVGLLKEAGLDVRLNIAGEGNLMAELKNLCESLSLTGQVNFLGLVEAEDMGELYRSNDVFVMSSVHEGMSNAMLEAMASGLPIVTTRCEGVEELIVDNGIVVDVCEPEPIAQAVRRLVDDGDGYERMCVAARSRAEQFSWRTVADEYIDCYRSVL
jgi:glycosyltransferase involved in cell wall biosynthesis